MSFEGTARPPRRWLHAATELDRFSMVTYRVDTEALAALLPSGATPELFTFDDGSSDALVSAVPFLDRDFHFRFAPFVPVSCGQINYRAYVRFRGERGVWFFGTSLDSIFVHLPRRVWQMPWHRDRITIDLDPPTGEGGEPHLRMRATGSWGEADCDLRITDRPLDRLDGFADRDETLEVLTHPMIGWYQRGDGRVGRYSVWHPVLEAHVCEVNHARFAVFERLGLITPDQQPHSAIAQRTLHFDVHTPPTRVR